jgi:hypothetical protein
VVDEVQVPVSLGLTLIARDHNCRIDSSGLCLRVSRYPQTNPRRFARHLPVGLPHPARRHPSPDLQLQIHPLRDLVVLFHLARERGHLPSAVHAVPDRRGRDDHHALSGGVGAVPGAVHSQLDLSVGTGTREVMMYRERLTSPCIQLLYRGRLRSHRRGGWVDSDRSVRRLWLHRESRHGLAFESHILQ